MVRAIRRPTGPGRNKMHIDDDEKKYNKKNKASSNRPPPLRFRFRKKRLLQRFGCFFFGVCLDVLTSNSLMDAWSFVRQLSAQSPFHLDALQQEQWVVSNNNMETVVANTPTKNIHNNTTKIVFLFVLGLEGTGHHLMHQIFKESPLQHTLVDVLEIDGRKTNKLRKWLFHFDYGTNAQKQKVMKGKGLWNAHCGKSTAKGPIIPKQKLKGSFDIDTMALETFIQTRLLGIASKVEMKQQRLLHKTTTTTSTSTGTILYYPINTMGGQESIGMASYPNFGGGCKFLNYPSMDLWYDSICTKVQEKNQAKVEIDCQHLYLYRNPLAVVQSTTVNRHFNPTILSALHLYETMLHIVYMQLDTFSDRTLDCFGILNAAKEETNSGSPFKDWRAVMQDVGGWEDNKIARENYTTFINSIYKAPHPINETQLLISWSSILQSHNRQASIPNKHNNNKNNNNSNNTRAYLYYLEPIKRLHERVVRRCHDIIRG